MTEKTSRADPLRAAVAPPGPKTFVGRFSWGLADQLLSSATNFLFVALVARTVTPRDFGAFSLAYATFTLSLGAFRALSGEPLVVRFSSVPADLWRQGVKASAGMVLVVGAAVGIGSLLTGVAIGGSLGGLLMILGLCLPVLLLQDTWRFALFACGRGNAALLNDATWAIVMFGVIAMLIETDLSSVGWYTAAWAGAGCLATLVGMLQVRLLPSPAGAVRWLVHQRDLGPRFLAEFVVSTGSSSLTLFGIGSLAGLAQLGRLRAGQVALGPLNILFGGANLVTVPESVRLLKESSQRLIRASRWISAVLAVAVVLWCLVLLTIPEDVGELLLGKNWDGARSLLLPLSIGSVGFALAYGAMTGLRALGAARRSLRARYIDATSTVTFALSGALLGGAIGAAWGFAIAGSLRIPNAWWQFARALREYRTESRRTIVAETTI